MGPHLSIALIFASILCVLPAWAGLENPSRGSIKSGVGLVSGWVCDADELEVSFNGGPRQFVPYGSERLDTRGTCGDTDNGFGLLWNYNELGDGRHNVALYVDGMFESQVFFEVQTLGTNFLQGVTGQGTLTLSDGKQVTVEWEESTQGFTITDYTPSRELPPPPATSGVGQFVGTWRFTNSRTTQTYRFGECPANTVVKPCVADVPQRTYLWPTYLFSGLGSLGHSYYLADVERSVCRVWLFYEPDGNRVSGHYGEAYGDCLSRSAIDSIAEDLTYERYPTTGTRSSQSATSPATTLEAPHPPVTAETQEALEQAIEDSLFLLMQ